ncbi:hypothetical protein PHISCL_01322 [Aspergillus sclerotialis]|uniref:Uncharacterized protein n=1 Tax=Aspergillus sclerotialis TaxID=2070753 RepID=A0A3A2ZT73_9EURO|nr:hypothetical protein PHISCL_01322 [Aspergillus sclerotialis]
MVSVVRLLVARGADVNYVNYQLDTPLTLGVRGNDRQVIDILLDKGKADMDVAGMTLTPIQVAYSLRNYHLAHYLERQWHERSK